MDRVVCLLWLLIYLESYCDSQTLIRNCGLDCATCDKGYYGPHCTLECLNCQHNQCNKTTGKCGMCSHGFYGWGCNKTCSEHCGGNNACDRDTGHCYESCVKSFWGQKCESNCSPKCNMSVCLHASGWCHLGCQDGWSGPYCNVSCETACLNITCSQINSCIECKNNNNVCQERRVCTNTCEQCYTGGRCTPKSTRSKSENGTLDESKTNTPETGTVVGAVIGVIVIVILAVILIVYRRRHRNHGGDRESRGDEEANLSHPEEKSPQTDADHESDKLTVQEASSAPNI